MRFPAEIGEAYSASLSQGGGLASRYISSLERGRRNPTIISLYELANAIGVRVADLIADEAAAVDESPTSGVADAAQAGSKTMSD